MGRILIKWRALLLAALPLLLSGCMLSASVEDLYVLPEDRGKGYGKALLCRLARIARDRGCGRMEWGCLDWNEPSIRFYRSLGAEPMEEWTVYRLAGETLDALARQDREA